jgi:hypothetical protein
MGDTFYASCQGPIRWRHARRQRVRNLEQILPNPLSHFGESSSESPLTVLGEPLRVPTSLETDDPVAECGSH